MIAFPHYEPMDVSTIDLSDPIDFSHPLAHGLRALWIGIPDWSGGNVWIDLVKGVRATYAQTSTQGWFPSTLPGFLSDVASTGSSEWDCGTGNYSFTGEVTTCAWLNPTSIGVAQYLMGNRSTSLGDWCMDSTRVIWNSASQLSCTSSPANGVWSFLAHSRSGSTGAWTAECWKGGLTSPVAANGSATGITSNPASNNGNVLGLGSSLSWNGRCPFQAWYDRYVPVNQLEWLRQISLIGLPGLCNHVSWNTIRLTAAGGGGGPTGLVTDLLWDYGHPVEMLLGELDRIY